MHTHAFIENFYAHTYSLNLWPVNNNSKGILVHEYTSTIRELAFSMQQRAAVRILSKIIYADR